MYGLDGCFVSLPKHSCGYFWPCGYKGFVVVPLCLNIYVDHFRVLKPELDIIIKVQIAQ